MIRRVLAVAVLVAAGASCGNDEGGSPLAEVDDALDDVTSAMIELEVSATALGGDDPVGFRLHGPFSFDEGGDYPVLDLTYTRLLGAEQQVATVTSNGSEVFVETGDGRMQVPEDQLAGLRLGDGDSAGLERLRVSEWVDEPKTSAKGGTDVTTGDVDLAECFADLAALANELGVPDAAQVQDLAGEDEDRLRRLVRDSAIRIESDRETSRLQLLDLSVELAPQGDSAVATNLVVRLALS